MFSLSADVIDDQISYEGGNKLRHDPNSWWFVQKPEHPEELESSEPSENFEHFELPPVHSRTRTYSEVDNDPYLPSIGSVMRDDFTEPLCPDYSHIRRGHSPNSPIVYEPFKTMGFSMDRSASDSGEKSPSPPPIYEKSLEEERS